MKIGSFISKGSVLLSKEEKSICRKMFKKIGWFVFNEKGLLVNQNSVSLKLNDTFCIDNIKTKWCLNYIHFFLYKNIDANGNYQFSLSVGVYGSFRQYRCKYWNDGRFCNLYDYDTDLTALLERGIEYYDYTALNKIKRYKVKSL